MDGVPPPDYFVRCPTCHGDGVVRRGKEYLTCFDCDGTGDLTKGRAPPPKGNRQLYPNGAAGIPTLETYGEK